MCVCVCDLISVSAIGFYLYSLEECVAIYIYQQLGYFVCVCISFFLQNYVDGYVIGFGNPDWATTHPAATSTALAILAVLRGGATCVCKTVMAEMAYRVSIKKNQ